MYKRDFPYGVAMSRLNSRLMLRALLQGLNFPFAEEKREAITTLKLKQGLYSTLMRNDKGKDFL